MAVEALTVAGFLAMMNERLVEWFISPLFKRFGIDTSWLMYVALVTGGVISFLAAVNLFPGMFAQELVGVIISAIIVGGGSNLLHDVFGAAKRSTRC